MKFGSVLLCLVFAVAGVSASCWDVNTSMPTGWGSFSAWLCTSSQVVGYFYSPTYSGPFSQVLHGQIQSTAPSGYTYGSGTYRVYLQSFTYTSPYPAVLKCYKRMGNPNSYWWLYQAQVTLNSGESTYPGIGNWISAGCPPVSHVSHQGGSTPQVQIGVNWNGFGKSRK